MLSSIGLFFRREICFSSLLSILMKGVLEADYFITKQNGKYETTNRQLTGALGWGGMLESTRRRIEEPALQEKLWRLALWKSGEIRWLASEKRFGEDYRVAQRDIHDIWSYEMSWTLPFLSPWYLQKTSTSCLYIMGDRVFLRYIKESSVAARLA